MQFTIRRIDNRKHVEVEIDASYRSRSYGIRLGAAVMTYVAQMRAAGVADLSETDLRGACLFGADLRGVNLRGAILIGAELKQADLRKTNLRNAHLCRADLRLANLLDANLVNADLNEVDLRGAILPKVPIIKNIDAAIYAAVYDGPGRLEMDSWHGCETTHCRAGWAITLAGKAGFKLEEKLGPGPAGALIYAASRPDRPVPDFYASNEDALADIKACANKS